MISPEEEFDDLLKVLRAIRKHTPDLHFSLLKKTMNPQGLIYENGKYSYVRGWCDYAKGVFHATMEEEITPDNCRAYDLHPSELRESLADRLWDQHIREAKFGLLQNAIEDS